MIEFIQTRILPSKTAQLFIRTFLKWHSDNCAEMGAALAYYALFSLFPIFLVILSIFGFVLGPDSQAAQQLLTSTRSALPSEAYNIVQATLVNLNQSSVGAGLVGFGLLLLSASQLFGALARAVDKIWQVEVNEAKERRLAGKALDFVKDKVLAFLLVLGTAAIILLSFVSNIAIQIVLEVSKQFKNAITWLQFDDVLLIQGLQVVISFALLTLAVMALFKILPSTKVWWRDIWLGAIVSAALLSLLQRLVSSGIVSIGEQFRAYGAIGGVMILLLWLYLTCQIFFLGCEFTTVYAQLFGSRRHRQGN